VLSEKAHEDGSHDEEDGELYIVYRTRATHAMGGTQSYAAPEILRRCRGDILSECWFGFTDMWSVGVVCYIISEVQLPFVEATDLSRAGINTHYAEFMRRRHRAITAATPLLTRLIDDDVSQDGYAQDCKRLDAFVAACLNPDAPRERPTAKSALVKYFRPVRSAHANL
jgi:serine/threonine protein kinase